MEEWINVIVASIASFILGMAIHSALGHSNPNWYRRLLEILGIKEKPKIPLYIMLPIITGMLKTKEFREIFEKALTKDTKNEGKKEGD